MASSKSIIDAYKKSIKNDPISIFGGIIALNRQVDKKIAQLLTKNFYEVISIIDLIYLTEKYD